ncbi:MAG: hypothetical protein RL186_337 [Pseudomonadota bacterium]|jgi:putative transposase
MWMDITRSEHARVGNGLPEHMTDQEWALNEPLLPARPCLGCPAKWTYREMVNGLFCVLRGGVPWRMLPRCEFPPMLRALLAHSGEKKSL